MKCISFVKHITVLLCVLILLSNTTISYSQQVPEDPSVELIKLNEKSSKRYQEQQARVKEYTETNGVPKKFKDANGRIVIMVDVENGIPVYKATDNSGAAITTGVPELRSGGSLGLNLEGEGMKVGIWDGGSALHPEYGDRVLSFQGNEDNHASHVTGTIMASGINPLAKGMAPKAQSFNYDFDNDETEMLTHAKPDQTTLLLSNHSYGLITGWYFNGSSWQWVGNSSISTSEDYRFGFYSSNAAFWDQIAFNAPYYTMLKSAGNDRNNTGPVGGAFPADCNGGSGFDCVGDVGTSKNIITVGAVNKVPSYVDASSVTMSSFSSWGPTDDGRIKPDFVAAGVNLFSSISGGAYGNLSGTSMATPNATGSLVLLQELYKNLHGGNFMRASTLKALAIHTTKEAGPTQGPDYKFGWGLLDVAAGAKFLLAEDNANFIIKEEILAQGQVIEYTLSPKANEKITATIVWTDPAGTPVAASLDPTNIMLVNDLDIRIVDDASNTQLPWILNPADPDAAATRGDNIRDNVEKIEFANPQERPYKLRVSHKGGTLRNGQQSFSLIISYTSLNEPGIAFYWRGGPGQWNDPTHWSFTSGGAAANVVPTANDRVFFDENSFSTGGTVTLSADAAVSSLVWFADENISLAMGGHTLAIGGNMIIASSGLTTTGNGKFLFTGEKSADNLVSFTDNVFGSLEFEFNGASAWKVEGLNEIHKIDLLEGELTISDQQFMIDILTSVSEDDRVLDISNSSLQGITQIELDAEGLDLQSNEATIIAVSNASIDLNGTELDGLLSLDGSNIEVSGNSSIASLEVSSGSSVMITGNNSIGSLSISENVELELAPGSIQTLTESTVIASSASNPVQIFSEGAAASLNFAGHFKLCFDNLIITNVNATGEAVVGAGLNSDITNSANWSKVACADILFANFSYGLSCVGSLVQFESTSTGAITEWSWNFGDPSTTLDVSEDESPIYIYDEVGNYTVTLTISNGTTTETFTREVTVGPNDLQENHIVLSGTSLFSFRSGASYQWYKDNEPIAGATERSYNFNEEEGIYIVVISNSTCNRASTPYVNIITGIEDDPDYLAKRVNVYPNPAQTVINVEVPASFGSHFQTTLFDTFGKALSSQSHSNRKTSVSVEYLQEGVYFIQIVNGNKRVVKKVLVSRH